MLNNTGKTLFLIMNSFLVLLFSCETTGLVFVRSGYPYNVKVCLVYNHNNEILLQTGIHATGIGFIANARQRKEYSNLIEIVIYDLEGKMLAKYTSEYLQEIRNAYKKKQNEDEEWIFTEKGLFFETLEFKNPETYRREVVRYYSSDAAVLELEERLKEK